MVRTHDPAESKSQMAEDELKSTEMLAGDLFATLAAAMMKVNYIIQTTIRGRQLIKLLEIFVETYLYSYQADKSIFHSTVWRNYSLYHSQLCIVLCCCIKLQCETLL